LTPTCTRGQITVTARVHFGRHQRCNSKCGPARALFVVSYDF
jgi:hypothetical protein